MGSFPAPDGSRSGLSGSPPPPWLRCRAATSEAQKKQDIKDGPGAIKLSSPLCALSTRADSSTKGRSWGNLAWWQLPVAQPLRSGARAFPSPQVQAQKCSRCEEADPRSQHPALLLGHFVQPSASPQLHTSLRHPSPGLCGHNTPTQHLLPPPAAPYGSDLGLMGPLLVSCAGVTPATSPSWDIRPPPERTEQGRGSAPQELASRALSRESHV